MLRLTTEVAGTKGASGGFAKSVQTLGEGLQRLIDPKAPSAPAALTVAAAACGSFIAGCSTTNIYMSGSRRDSGSDARQQDAGVLDGDSESADAEGARDAESPDSGRPDADILSDADRNDAGDAEADAEACVPNLVPTTCNVREPVTGIVSATSSVQVDNLTFDFVAFEEHDGAYRLILQTADNCGDVLNISLYDMTSPSSVIVNGVQYTVTVQNMQHNEADPLSDWASISVSAACIDSRCVADSGYINQGEILMFEGGPYGVMLQDITDSGSGPVGVFAIMDARDSEYPIQLGPAILLAAGQEAPTDLGFTIRANLVVGGYTFSVKAADISLLTPSPCD